MKKNKLDVIFYIILSLQFVIFFYLVFIGRNQYIYNIDYIKCISFMILTSLTLYIYGIKKNDKKIFDRNIVSYILLFFLLLFSITFIIGRDKLHLYSWWYYAQFIPFKTIKSQIEYGSYISILKNVVGNSIMLIPLSFLLMIKSKKYNNILKQIVIILPIIIFIEIFQAYTHTGSFDIDDIILNYLGTVFFTFTITRFNIIKKIRNLFYIDYNLKPNIKNLLFYLSIFIMFLFDFFIFLGRF